MARRELVFQNHIIDSYKACGGASHKWATEMSGGKPDLVCHLNADIYGWPGSHLTEVKHRPTFGKLKINNPMTEQQKSFARRWVAAGGEVFLALVSGPKAIQSRLWLFDATLDTIDPVGYSVWVAYQPGIKYDMRHLMRLWKDKQ